MSPQVQKASISHNGCRDSFSAGTGQFQPFNKSKTFKHEQNNHFDRDDGSGTGIMQQVRIQ